MVPLPEGGEDCFSRDDKVVQSKPISIKYRCPTRLQSAYDFRVESLAIDIVFACVFQPESGTAKIAYTCNLSNLSHRRGGVGDACLPVIAARLSLETDYENDGRLY